MRKSYKKAAEIRRPCEDGGQGKCHFFLVGPCQPAPPPNRQDGVRVVGRQDAAGRPAHVGVLRVPQDRLHPLVRAPPEERKEELFLESG